MADGSQLGNAFFADFGPSAPPSGGTITGVTAGVGLSGGGLAGQVNIDLETPVTIANGGTGGSTATGTGQLVLQTSPALVTPTATTPVTGDNSTSVATTAFVKNVVAGLPAGTITNVSAGHGLTGGGASGAVTLALATPVAVADGGTGATTTTGTGANVLATSPTLVTPALGTPTGINLANATNLPTSAFAAGVTGAGAVVLASSPALLNTPTAPTAAPGTSTTQLATTAFVAAAIGGLPGGTITAVNPGAGLTGGGASGAVTIGLATPVAVANGGTGTTTSTGSGANVLATGPALANPVFTNPTLGTPASGNLSNCLGLPVAGITGVLTVAQGGTGVTTSTGTGANVLATSPTLVTPALGTPSSGNLANCTGLPVGALSGNVVTSIGLVMPSDFTVAGSPVTGAGNITVTRPNQAANTVLAAPSGAAGAPAYRTLVGADLPNPAAASKGGIQSLAAVSNQFVNSISTAGVAGTAQPSTANLSDRDAAATAFTPTVNVTTIGDGVFSGVSATGGYRRLGFLVWFWVNVRFTLTYTTATGTLSIGGFPLAPVAGQGGIVPWWLNPLVSPSDHLMGTFNNGLLVAQITTTAQVGNFWGPSAANSFGLASGTAYQLWAGGVYITNA